MEAFFDSLGAFGAYLRVEANFNGDQRAVARLAKKVSSSPHGALGGELSESISQFSAVIAHGVWHKILDG